MIVCKDTQKILGVHIVGADAANLVHIGQCFMMTEFPIQRIVDEVIFNYPTLAEAYKIAATMALKEITGDITGMNEPTLHKDENAA